MNVGSSVSYRKDPSETTEWDDIQRKLGNLPPLPEKAAPPPVDDAEIDDESALRVVLDSHTVEELAEVDDDEFADDRFFEEYRAKRIAELRGKEAAERFGEVYPLTKPEFLKEVTEASKDGTWILILLFQAGLVESRVVEEAFTQLARLHRTVKFMKIIATQCIENYPDRNVPTVLVYHNGELATQLVGAAALGGLKTNVEVLEWIISKTGALASDLPEDPRAEGYVSRGMLERY